MPLRENIHVSNISTLSRKLSNATLKENNQISIIATMVFRGCLKEDGKHSIDKMDKLGSIMFLFSSPNTHSMENKFSWAKKIEL